jgi:hypothetical protein
VQKTGTRRPEIGKHRHHFPFIVNRSKILNDEDGDDEEDEEEEEYGSQGLPR